jgi:hypothetical protein
VKQPPQEDLIGYVLGALDAQEQRDLQKEIDLNPALEDQLMDIKSSLLPLDCLDTAGPTPGLARRTCEMVAGYQPGSTLLNAVEPSLSSLDDCLDDFSQSESANSDSTVRLKESSQQQRNMMRPSTWSIPDLTVAVALMAIVAGILLPTISYARHNSRIYACQGNMQQLGMAFLKYSDVNGGKFVEIPRCGPLAVSGSFAPMLKECGFLEDSTLACAGVSSEVPVVVPSVQAVMNATGEQLCYYQKTMAGHYGYTMGYHENDRYHSPTSQGRTHVVLLADMPALNGRSSQNHGGTGQNCLFEDGRYEFVKGDSYGEDAIFVNDRNMVAPGCRAGDNVIAPSHLSLAVTKIEPLK